MKFVIPFFIALRRAQTKDKLSFGSVRRQTSGVFIISGVRSTIKASADLIVHPPAEPGGREQAVARALK